MADEQKKPTVSLEALLTPEKQKQFRDKFVDELLEQAWRHQVNAAHDLPKIDETKALQAAKLRELNDPDNGLKVQLKTLAEEGKALEAEAVPLRNISKKARTPEQREKLQELNNAITAKRDECKKKADEITKAEEFVLSCDEVVNMINQNAQAARTKAAQAAARADFVRVYEYKDPAPEPEAPAAEEAKTE